MEAPDGAGSGDRQDVWWSKVEPPFVGDGHREVLTALLAAYRVVQNGAGPKVVLLEAPTGWGKSRVIHEFYRTIAAKQTSPVYWPPSILEACLDRDASGSDPDVSTARKHMFPRVVSPEENAEMGWLWWGLSCNTLSNGLTEDTFLTNLEQLRAHAGELKARLFAKHPAREAYKRAKGKLKGQAVSTALGKVVPYLSEALTFVEVVRDASQAVVESRSAREAHEVDTDGSKKDDVLIAETVEMLVAVADAKVPVIVAVEDLHLADDALVSLLIELANRNGSQILVVATTLTGKLDGRNSEAARILTDLSNDRALLHIKHDPDATEPAGHGNETVLIKLTLEDRITIACHMLGEQHLESATLIAERYDTPLALMLVCGIRLVRRANANPAKLEGVLSELPSNIQDLYGALWSDLDENTRSALLLMVAATPQAAGENGLPGRLWDAQLPGQAAVVSELLEGAWPSLNTNAGLAVWVRELEQWLQGCHDEVQYQALLGLLGRNDVLDEDDFADYRTALAASIDLDDPGLTTSRRVQFCRLLVSYALAGVLPWDANTIHAADMLADLLRDEHHSDMLTLRGRLALEVPRVPVGTHDSATAPDLSATTDAALERLKLGAEAWGELRRWDETEASCSRIFEALVERCGLDSPEAPADVFFVPLGFPPVRAALLLRQTLERLVEKGASEETLLEYRLALARMLLCAGQHDEAIAEQRAFVAGYTRTLGPDHENTLKARRDLASALSYAGQDDEAIAEDRAIVADLTEKLGPDHENTLKARRDLASALSNAGQRDEAIAEHRAIVADLTEKLGADHENTLKARPALAWALSKAGQRDEALAEHRAIVAGLTETLGPDHGETLSARRSLASALSSAGQRDEAIAEQRAFVAGYTRTLGVDHGYTLWARSHLTWALSKAGQHDEAIAEQRAFVADLTETLGPDHGETLRARSDLAWALSSAGQRDEAIAEQRAFVADLTETLGPDHGETLRARSDLAWALSSAGQRDEAIAEHRAIVAGYTETLGPDREESLLARSPLASALSEAGQHDEALAEHRAIVAGLTEALGPDHRSTLWARCDLASALSEAGQHDEAVAELEELPSTLIAQFGEENLLTEHAQKLLEEAHASQQAAQDAEGQTGPSSDTGS